MSGFTRKNNYLIACRCRRFKTIRTRYWMKLTLSGLPDKSILIASKVEIMRLAKVCLLLQKPVPNNFQSAAQTCYFLTCQFFPPSSAFLLIHQVSFVGLLHRMSIIRWRIRCISIFSRPIHQAVCNWIRQRFIDLHLRPNIVLHIIKLQIITN